MVQLSFIPGPSSQLPLCHSPSAFSNIGIDTSAGFSGVQDGQTHCCHRGWRPRAHPLDAEWPYPRQFHLTLRPPDQPQRAQPVVQNLAGLQPLMPPCYALNSPTMPVAPFPPNPPLLPNPRQCRPSHILALLKKLNRGRQSASRK